MRARSPTSSRDLRLVAKIGDEHDVARRHEQQRARAGEAGEISDVRQARDEQPVEMRGREAVDERREAARAGIRALARELSRRDREARARSRTRRVRTTTPTAAGASIECRRSGSRA